MTEAPGRARTLRLLLLLTLPALLLVGLYARSLDYGFAWMDETEIAEREIVLGDEPWVEAFKRPLHRTPDYAGGATPTTDPSRSSSRPPCTGSRAPRPATTARSR